jgi:magnesium chelatase subunit I
MKEIIAEVTLLARRSSDISQRSGVSVRVSICNYESMLANALKRSIRNRERQVAPRVSDLTALAATTGGTIELESVGETSEEKIVERLIQRAVLNVFNRHFTTADLDELVENFERGLSIETSDAMSSLEYMTQAGEVSGLTEAMRKLGAQGNPALVASAMELVLEGLHLHRKLNKDRVAGARGRFSFRG